MRLSGRELVVECAEESVLEVYSASGALELRRSLSEGTSTVELKPGVHICRLAQAPEVAPFKAIVK